MLLVNPVEWRKPTTAKSAVAKMGEAYVEWGGKILPSQLHFLNEAYKQDKNGKWVYNSIIMNAPRQNAKTKMLTAAIITFIYVYNLNIFVTAHEVDAINKIFNDVMNTVQQSPELLAEIDKYSSVKGKISFNKGATITFRSRRSNGAGMGQTADVVIFDEAQELRSGYEGMITKTLKTRPNALIIYTGTPYLPESQGDVFHEVLKSADKDKKVFAVRYGVDDDSVDVEDEKLWKLTNPLFPDVIGRDAFNRDLRVARQGGELGLMDFRIQDLGLWWEDKVPPAIPTELWESAYRTVKHDSDTLVYALVYDPKQSVMALSVAAYNGEDGQYAPYSVITGEIVDERSSVESWNWIENALKGAPRDTTLLLDAAGLNNPMREIIPRGISIVQLSGTEFLASQQGFMNMLNQGTFKHPNNPTLNAEVENASETKSGDLWKFDNIRKGQTVAGLKGVAEAAWYRSVNLIRKEEEVINYV